MNEMSTNIPTIADAIALAAEHHRDTDKGGAPYILHPIRVMLAMTTDEARRVALLHDVIEDTNVTAEDLRGLGYPDREIAALEALTRKKSETYEDFIERVRANPLATIVKRADLVDNMDIRRLPHIGLEEAARLAKYLRAWRRLQDEDHESLPRASTEPKSSRTVRLVDVEGPTSMRIDANINEAGDLVISGQDTGEAPSQLFGDRDYEYWLTVRSQHKDDALLALIEKLYAGDTRAEIRLRELLEGKGIPCEFHNYM